MVEKHKTTNKIAQNQEVPHKKQNQKQKNIALTMLQLERSLRSSTSTPYLVDETALEAREVDGLVHALSSGQWLRIDHGLGLQNEFAMLLFPWASRLLLVQ